MTKEYKLYLAKIAGLIYEGENSEGEDEFMGDESQWEEFEKLKNKTNV